MTDEDIKKLKEELKKEILNEMTTKQIVKDNSWKEVKYEFEKMFYSKGYTTNKEQNAIFSAISTITRIALGYNQVQIIPIEKSEDIRQIMYKILNIFPSKISKEE